MIWMVLGILLQTGDGHPVCITALGVIKAHNAAVGARQDQSGETLELISDATVAKVISIIVSNLPQDSFNRLGPTRQREITDFISGRLSTLASNVPGTKLAEWELSAQLDAIDLELRHLSRGPNFAIERADDALLKTVNDQIDKLVTRIAMLLHAEANEFQLSREGLEIFAKNLRNELHSYRIRSTTPMFKTPLPDAEFNSLLDELAVDQAVLAESIKGWKGQPSFEAFAERHSCGKIMSTIDARYSQHALETVFKSIDQSGAVSQSEFDEVNRRLLSSSNEDRVRHKRWHEKKHAMHFSRVDATNRELFKGFEERFEKRKLAAKPAQVRRSSSLFIVANSIAIAVIALVVFRTRGAAQK